MKFKAFMSQFKDNIVFQNSILSFLFHIGLNLIGSLLLLGGSMLAGGNGSLSMIVMIFLLVMGLFSYQIIGEMLMPTTNKKDAFFGVLTVPLVNLFIWLLCFAQSGGFQTPLAQQSPQIWATFGAVNPVLMTGSVLMAAPLPLYALLVLVIEPLLMFMGMMRKDKMPIPETYKAKRFFEQKREKKAAQEKNVIQGYKKNNKSKPSPKKK